MTTERDELRIKLLGFGGTISSCWPERGGVFDQKKAEHAADETADAILAAGYRKPQQVTTVEELDALPVLSVVLDKHGESYQKLVTDEGSTSPLWMAGDVVLSALIDLPATVLHVGGEE